jgi:RNA polymerase sigma-19 factor, ECF subfamily
LPTDTQNFVAKMATHYSRRLRRFLSARLRNPHEVPDLAQEVFLRLLRVQQHESIRSPEAYLFTIASHVIHQHALRKSSEPVTVDIANVFAELQALGGDDPVARADSATRIGNLERILKGLPPRVATALVMHKLGGYTVQEIAGHGGEWPVLVHGHGAHRPHSGIPLLEPCRAAAGTGNYAVGGILIEYDLKVIY